MCTKSATWTFTNKTLAVEMEEVPSPPKHPLYDALVQIMNSVMGGDTDMQKKAVDKLNQVQVLEEYPLVVSQIIGTEEENIHVRELAAIFLKNYLDEILNHTQSNCALFHKSFGKSLTLQLIDFLADSSLPLKECLAACIAKLLCLGFWADATILLNDMVKHDDEEDISNAVLVLNKAIDNPYLGNHEYTIIEYHWFDVLLDVLKRRNTLSKTKERVIQPMFLLMKHSAPNLQYVPDCLTKITEELDVALNACYSISFDFGFRTEILKFLNNSVDQFSEYCHIFIAPLLPTIGKLLTLCCEQYKEVIKGATPPKDELEEGEPKHFYDLIGGILDFIMNLVDMPYFDVLMEDLENLIYCIYVFMSCHHGMEAQLYLTVIEKDHLWSLRDVCSQIITFSLEKIDARQKNGKAVYFKTMHIVFQRLVAEMEPQPINPFHAYYITSLTEAMMFGTGLIKERYVATDPEFAFPLQFYINNWTNMISPENLILQGRILWVGGIYCLEINPSVMECHLKYIIRNLQSDNTYILIPSAEALCNYLKSFKAMPPEKKFLISQVAVETLNCLVAVTRMKNKFPLHHSLNALGYFVKSQNNLACKNIDELEDLLVKITSAFFTDQCVMREVNFVCAKIAQIQGFKTLANDKFLTFLHHVINNLEPRYMTDDIDKAFDILNTICVYSPTQDEDLVLQTFLGAATQLSQNKDREEELDESAANLLITLIVKRQDQIRMLSTLPKGMTIIAEFPQLLNMLLQPGIVLPKNVLGKLVITTIFCLPNVMEAHYETVLRNVITGCAKSPSKKIRANWSIFIFICMIRTTGTLNYLSVLPGPHGGSALNFIMRLWEPQYFHAVDFIDRKILVLSIVHVIQHCLDHENEYKKMAEIVIPYDLPNDASPTGEIFNGLEYLYYLLIQCVLYEEKRKKIKPPRPEPYDFDDFGEDSSVRKEDDALLLFYCHPFNINTMLHIVNFLQRASAPYFSVMRRFMPQAIYFTLRDMGCNVPEPEMNVPEDME
ncbi:uncharacterized protein LOC109538000 [Dendroctonus ponderosae]|uniref:Exportin-2 central domain-containing protein n=1 Tax=Dendroctonus ponderosae TaxID=77166 RepID=A0AAR5PHR0_DENPD|nr:uncharacterized protein LOC109538000 [Dendroctonus ponderosae]KAH1023203.1 hypothetical protein HUJ04_012452 [Dendroctonus ponderosae]